MYNTAYVGCPVFIQIANFTAKIKLVKLAYQINEICSLIFEKQFSTPNKMARIVDTFAKHYKLNSKHDVKTLSYK